MLQTYEQPLEKEISDVGGARESVISIFLQFKKFLYPPANLIFVLKSVGRLSVLDHGRSTGAYPYR